MHAGQGYKMKDEDFDAFIEDGVRIEGGMYTAVEALCENKAAAKAQYG